MLRQETEPSSLVVSDVTVDQELPPSLVPASASVEPAPAVPVQPAEMTREIAAVAPQIAGPAAGQDEDFGSQISELRDMFPRDTRRTVRPAFA